jgi:hypothetical protein
MGHRVVTAITGMTQLQPMRPLSPVMNWKSYVASYTKRVHVAKLYVANGAQFAISMFARIVAINTHVLAVTRELSHAVNATRPTILATSFCCVLDPYKWVDVLRFFNERVDALYVDDELMPKPKTPWSE